MAVVAAALICNTSAWSQPPALCSPVCPALALPDNGINCTKMQYSHDFSSPSIWTSMYQWYPANIPLVFQPFHYTVTDGRLVTNSSSQCITDAVTNPILSFLSQPSFLDIATKGQWYSYNFTVSITSGVLGGVFRVQDGLNYYYVVLDRNNGSTRAGIVMNGVGLSVTSSLGRFNWPGGRTYKTGQSFSLSVQTNTTGFLVYVSRFERSVPPLGNEWTRRRIAF